jgi:3,5-epimerase/4-reductase
MKILFYGGKGWIGKMLIEEFNKEENNVLYISDERVDYFNQLQIQKEIETIQPDRVICMLGRTSGYSEEKERYIPNIDYLEEKGKLYENVRDNLYSPLLLSIICNNLNIHLTYIGTGCIFSRDTRENDKIYTEEDEPDFRGSSYSIVKGFTDQIIPLFDNTLNIRIRMPIVKDYTDPKSFVSKIISFENIFSMPNSMTYLPNLLPLIKEACLDKVTGTLNVVNKNGISHSEILEIYKQQINPQHTYKLITENELSNFVVSKRSNNILSSSRLELLYPGRVKDIRDCIEEMFKSE